MSAAQGSSSAGRANKLNEKINQIVHEHHQWLEQLEHAELVRLRAECLKLSAEVEKLRAEAEFPKETGPSGDKAPFEEGQVQDALGERSLVDRLRYQLDSAKAEIEEKNKYCKSLEEALQTDPQGKSIVVDTVGPAREAVDSEGLLEGVLPRAVTKEVRSRTLEDREAEQLDLKSKFNELDPEDKGYVRFEAITDHFVKQLHDEDAKDALLTKYRSVIYKLNRKNGILGQLEVYTNAKGTVQKKKIQDHQYKFHIYYPTFKAIMLDDIVLLQQEFGIEMAEGVVELRQILIDDIVKEQICHAWRVKKSEVDATMQSAPGKFGDTILRWLDPIVGAMIILNALCIGISLDNDPRWDGWFVFECIFTSFFLTELLIVLRIRGCADYWMGVDWMWNWFDFIIVLFALVDLVFTVIKRSGVESMRGVQLRQLLVLRLVRIVRITRLIRILRLKIFKELQLMVNGVIAGFRVLFWAIVLLFTLIYALGILMRELMDPDHSEFDCTNHAILKGLTYPGQCNRGALVMDEYGPYMFSTVPRAMLTIFSCYTDGCASPDGTPLIWHLWDTHGPLLVLGYVASFLFVTFGVLNLIMAVFVENTLASAERTDAERQFGEQSDHVKKAQDLQILLHKFCTERVNGAAVQDPSTNATIWSSDKGLVRTLNKYKGMLARAVADSTGNKNLMAEHLNMRITQDQFEELLTDNEVSDILEELDISCISREQLFDILDSDGNGFLAISELVDGIMKLRGPADKGDGVASVLMIRQLQKQMSKFESTVRRNFENMSHMCRVLEHRQGLDTDSTDI